MGILSFICAFFYSRPFPSSSPVYLSHVNFTNFKYLNTYKSYFFIIRLLTIFYFNKLLFLFHCRNPCRMTALSQVRSPVVLLRRRPCTSTKRGKSISKVVKLRCNYEETTYYIVCRNDKIPLKAKTAQALCPSPD